MEAGFIMGWWNKMVRENKRYQHAEVKFNGGRGACLCNRCSVILSYGTDHEDIDRYCGECYNKLADALFDIANMRPHADSIKEIKQLAKEVLRDDTYE